MSLVTVEGVRIPPGLSCSRGRFSNSLFWITIWILSRWSWCRGYRPELPEGCRVGGTEFGFSAWRRRIKQKEALCQKRSRANLAQSLERVSRLEVLCEIFHRLSQFAPERTELSNFWLIDQGATNNPIYLLRSRSKMTQWHSSPTDSSHSKSFNISLQIEPRHS